MTSTRATLAIKNIIIFLIAGFYWAAVSAAIEAPATDGYTASEPSKLTRRRAIPQKTAKTALSVPTQKASPIRSRKKGKNPKANRDVIHTNALQARKLARQTTKKMKKAKRRVVGR